MKAEDFHVGQVVVCTDPQAFFSEIAKYLTNREGIVKTIWPSTTPRDSPMRKNQVCVTWQKRNGRGKERDMVMQPRDIQPKE